MPKNSKLILFGIHIPPKFHKEMKDFVEKVNNEPDRVIPFTIKELAVYGIKNYMKNYKFKKEGE